MRPVQTGNGEGGIGGLGGSLIRRSRLKFGYRGKTTWVRDVVRHLIFPSAYFVLLLVLILFGVFTKFAAGSVNLEGLVWLLGLARDNFIQWNWRFGEMAALVLAWPYLAPHWERFFAGNCRTYARWDTGRSLAGLALAALAGLAYWMGPSA